MCNFIVLLSDLCLSYYLMSLLRFLVNIGIKHGFPCINVCQVPREMLIWLVVLGLAAL